LAILGWGAFWSSEPEMAWKYHGWFGTFGLFFHIFGIKPPTD
jgi:hypothetical protein